MKTISPAAMAEIEAGTAVFAGAVEITPLNLTYFTTIGMVELDAIANAATTAAGGLISGVELTGFDPTDIVRVSLPVGQAHVAYSVWGVPAHTGFHTGSENRVNIIPDGVAADAFAVGTNPPGFDGTFGWDGYETARAAFGTQIFSGASAYTFFILDSPTGDNSGGLSIMVERGVAVGSAPTQRLWGGYWPLNIGGHVFAPLGATALVQQGSGAIGGVAQALQIGLSGIDPELAALADDAIEYKNASVAIYQLIFSGDGITLLDAPVFDRGRIDVIDSDEVIGAAASLMATVESAARSLGRSGGRMRSDSDQRLIDPNDGYLKHIAYAYLKSLYWGGKRPAIAGGALSGGGSSAGAGSTGGTLLGLQVTSR